jgi:hypothetical protein
MSSASSCISPFIDPANIPSKPVCAAGAGDTGRFAADDDEDEDGDTAIDLVFTGKGVEGRILTSGTSRLGVEWVDAVVTSSFGGLTGDISVFALVPLKEYSLFESDSNKPPPPAVLGLEGALVP